MYRATPQKTFSAVTNARFASLRGLPVVPLSPQTRVRTDADSLESGTEILTSPEVYHGIVSLRQTGLVTRMLSRP
jgi:hypothetical protein